MSNCMTIEESIDQKDTCTEVAPKDVVEFILEEALLSAFIISDKDCSRIGDFNITDDFRQQYDRLSLLKDFEQIDQSQKQSASNQESNLNSRENADRPGNLVTGKDNLESIIDSFCKKKDKITPSNECTVISEDVLADSELQIKNGQIHLEKNKTDKVVSEPEKPEHVDNKDDIKDEKIEIEYYNEGKLNKIYVPLKPSSNPNIPCVTEQEQGEEKNKESSEEREVKNVIKDELDKVNGKDVTERPFKPFTTEELRQSTLQEWENGNSSLVGKWDGDMLTQTEEVVRLMEELSSAQVLPDSFADPNRPRACAFAEEDVKKMIKEIEEISFTQSRTNSDDFDVGYFPDGQGDADLESKSFTKSKDGMEKSHKERKPQEELCTNSSSNSRINNEKKNETTKEDLKQEQHSSENLTSSQSKELSNHIYATQCPDAHARSKSLDNIDNEDTNISLSSELKLSACNIKEANRSQYQIEGDESLLKDSFYSENNIGASLDQDLCPTLNNDPSSEEIYEMNESISRLSYSVSKEIIDQKPSEVFTNDSINLKDFQNNRNICEEFLPESISLSGNVGSLSGSKQDEFTLKNLELSSELDMKFQEKHSDIIKGSRSVNNTSETTSEWNHSTQEGIVNLGQLSCASGETYNIPNLHSVYEGKNLADSESIVRMTEEKTESDDPSGFYQKSSLPLGRYETNTGGNSTVGAKEINEILEENFVRREKSAKSFEELGKKKSGTGNELFDTKKGKNQTFHSDSDLSLAQNIARAPDSSKSLNSIKETIDTEAKELSASSQSLPEAQESKESLADNEFSDDPEGSNPSAQKFKLHSQKMYFGTDYDPARQALNEFTLTESEETFIDLTESVIQIIEPPENSADEECDKVTFSLLSEMPNPKSLDYDIGSDCNYNFEKNDNRESEIPTKKTYSGMSTIGPIKNIDYDPKDLTAPEIDFGKMTRITSSRQLAKDMNLFSSEVNATLSVKIIEEDDSDDEASLNVEEDRVERSSLVNRDIASLTKVQKVREVMSYQPKSEEDFEDEESLPRPRLDLKDVESMTDERYKMPDVGIPLLSFEIGDSNLDAGKELIESMGLVISELTNPAYYEEESEEESAEIKRNESVPDTNCTKGIELSNNNVVHSISLKNLTKDDEAASAKLSLEKESKSKSKAELSRQPEEDETLRPGNSNEESSFIPLKYSTLGSVFKKASSKFSRKDGDFFFGNSKSLPRDTSKMSTTDSIRSLLDDCQSSASSMLNKSRSFLRNTQSIFKSISQSRVTSDRDLENSGVKKKLSPSDSDVSTIEKKFQSFLKKEDFAKAKNLIKCKVEKTLRNFDMSSPTVSKPEVSTEKKELRVAIRNEENLRVDRVENFKKLLPKSPLVYKSQFVKSQISFQSGTTEIAEVAVESTPATDQQNVEEIANAAEAEGIDEATPGEETDPQEAEKPKEVSFQEKLQWVSSVEGLYSQVTEECEQNQPDYIIMETIQGLPPADLESPSSEKENLDVEKNAKIKIEKENDIKKIEASNSFQLIADGACNVAPCFPELDEEKLVTKTSSERKMKTKKKKFTARFRNFWCSAFGRVKTSPKKGNLS